MPKKLFDSASARGAGKRSGQARYKLTLAQVEAELGTLVTLEDAQRRLDLIKKWALAGLLPGSVAGGMTRSIEVWIKASGVDAVYLDRR